MVETNLDFMRSYTPESGAFPGLKEKSLTEIVGILSASMMLQYANLRDKKHSVDMAFERSLLLGLAVFHWYMRESREKVEGSLHREVEVFLADALDIAVALDQSYAFYGRPFDNLLSVAQRHRRHAEAAFTILETEFRQSSTPYHVEP